MTTQTFSPMQLPSTRSIDSMLGALQMPDGTRESDGWCRALEAGDGFRYDYDASVAQGGWEFYRLAQGLSMAVTDMVAARPIPRRHALGDHLMLSICLEGGIPMRQRSGDHVRLSSGYCAVYGLSADEELSMLYETGQPLKWITVFIERQSLLELTGLRAQDLPEDVGHFLMSGESPAMQMLALSPTTTLIARQIVECPYKNGFLFAYLKAKALELACDILFTLARNLQEPRLGSIQLSPRDHRKLKQAMAIIDTTLEQAPDIEKLVAAVGLSRPKLQLGFRLLYGDTVARVRDKRRMEHALKLVRTTQLSMVDIAAEVGYEHAASFTRAFKAAYGDAPLKLRRAAQHSSLVGHLEQRHA